MGKTNRYYWLKMPKDFFKKHDMKIIEGMQDGKTMVLFYLKLLCESIGHDGNLRYSDRIPYTNEMLASVTNTELSIVEKAMSLFVDLGLVEILEDKTIFMVKVPEMTGSETEGASYMRRYRAQEKEAKILGEFENVNLSVNEINKLKEFYPNYWIRYVEKLSAYKESTGKTYDSDYATIKQWLMMDVGDME